MNITEAMWSLQNHPATANTRACSERVRLAARDFATAVLREAPETPETTIAIRKIEEALMWANKSITMARQDPLFD